VHAASLRAEIRESSVVFLVVSLLCARAEGKEGACECEPAAMREKNELFEWRTESEMFLYHFRDSKAQKKQRFLYWFLHTGGQAPFLLLPHLTLRKAE
jgi:hypothetical protein